MGGEYGKKFNIHPHPRRQISVLRRCFIMLYVFINLFDVVAAATAAAAAVHIRHVCASVCLCVFVRLQDERVN